MVANKAARQKFKIFFIQSRYDNNKSAQQNLSV